MLGEVADYAENSFNRYYSNVGRGATTSNHIIGFVRMRCCRDVVGAAAVVAGRADRVGRVGSARNDRDDGNDDGTGLMFRTSSEHFGTKSSVDVDLACLVVLLACLLCFAAVG